MVGLPGTTRGLTAAGTHWASNCLLAPILSNKTNPTITGKHFG
jgi:hypothetical protein